jgi:WD40 repeat protein
MSALRPVFFVLALAASGTQLGGCRAQTRSHKTFLPATEFACTPVCLAFSADGRTVVAGTLDGTVVLLDAADGAVVSKYATAPSLIRSVALSREGGVLLTVHADGVARTFALRTGQALYELKLDGTRVRCASLSADGRYVATGHDDGRICLWDATSGSYLDAVRARSRPVLCLAFSSKNNYLASVSHLRELQVWSADTRAEAASLAVAPADDILSVTWSRDGRRLYVPSTEGSVTVWSWPDGKEAFRLQTGFGGLFRAVPVLDDEYLWLSPFSGPPALWAAAQGAIVRRFGTKEICTGAADVSPDGAYVVTGGVDDVVFWHTMSGDVVRRVDMRGP